MADRRFAFAIPGDLDAPTGGYAYDRRVVAELSRAGWTVDLVALPGSFPAPSEADLAVTEARLSALPAGLPVLVDGLALGAMPDLAGRVAAVRPLIALVHHPLALETGTPPDRAAALRQSETAALAAAAAVVVTSPATAEILVADYRVPPARLTVAPPGTDRVPPARGSGGPGVAMLSVGTLIARKGHLDLVEALAGLKNLDWRLDIVGSLALDAAHAAAVAAAIGRHGLGSRIRLLGALPAADLAARYDAADLFVLASHYEGYGMAYAEALAHGLPVVGTTGAAAAPEVAEAAVLVPPGDTVALALALRGLLSDRDARADRAGAARRAAAGLPDWSASAGRIAAVIEGLA